MNLGNALTAMVAPAIAHRVKDQRVIIAVTVLAMAAGLLGSQYAPTGSAVAWVLLLGFGQGASLGLAIFFTMARAPDPVTAASLSGFAQSSGYLIAAAGPLAVGFLHTATGGWTVPVLALLAALCLQLWAGLLAGREVDAARRLTRTSTARFVAGGGGTRLLWTCGRPPRARGPAGADRSGPTTTKERGQ